MARYAVGEWSCILCICWSAVDDRGCFVFFAQSIDDAIRNNITQHKWWVLRTSKSWQLLLLHPTFVQPWPNRDLHTTWFAPKVDRNEHVDSSFGEAWHGTSEVATFLDGLLMQYMSCPAYINIVIHRNTLHQIYNSKFLNYLQAVAPPKFLTFFFMMFVSKFYKRSTLRSTPSTRMQRWHPVELDAWTMIVVGRKREDANGTRDTRVPCLIHQVTSCYASCYVSCLILERSSSWNVLRNLSRIT